MPAKVRRGNDRNSRRHATFGAIYKTSLTKCEIRESSISRIGSQREEAKHFILVSSGLIGFLLGAAIHGTIADRFGRRVTLLGGVWITSVFTLATAVLAHSFMSFIVLRVLTGLGLGVLMPLGTTYINEFAPRRVTNVFTLWGAGLGWSMGGTVAGLVGVPVTPYFGWQSLYYFRFAVLSKAPATNGPRMAPILPTLSCMPKPVARTIILGHMGEGLRASHLSCAQFSIGP